MLLSLGAGCSAVLYKPFGYTGTMAETEKLFAETDKVRQMYRITNRSLVYKELQTPNCCSFLLSSAHYKKK